MIRLEIKRANLRKGISAQHFRNTFILKMIQQQYTAEDIVKQVGFKTDVSLKGTIHTMRKLTRTRVKHCTCYINFI